MSDPTYTIRSLPQEERPRERLRDQGAENLSTSELLAIVLGSGTKGKPVLQLAHELLSHYGTLNALAEATPVELCQIRGMGFAKAIQLKAALTLSTRMLRQKRVLRECCIQTPHQAYLYFTDVFQGAQEERLVALLQDCKKKAMRCEVIAVGTLSKTLVHPREVFYPAIRHKAASLIIAHNHPSGDPTPSRGDIAITQILYETGELLQIPLNDHLVIGEGCYTSLRQEKLGFPV